MQSVGTQSMSAAEFEKLGREERREVVSHLRVLARVEPSHKQQLVELLQEDGQVLFFANCSASTVPEMCTQTAQHRLLYL